MGWVVAAFLGLAGAAIGGCIGAARSTTSIMMTGLESLINTVLGAAVGLAVGLLAGLSIRSGMK
jgi:hypothetical protein